MLQNKLTYYTLNPQELRNKSGLVFSLPHPIIDNKNAIQTQSQNKSSHHKIKFEFSSQIPYEEQISKKLKKIKEKSKSMLEISHKNIQQEDFDSQKHIYRQTLYKKWIEKSKKAQQSPQGDCQSKKDKNYNIHLRKLNLVVLSKRQQLKKNLKNQEKEKQKDQIPPPPPSYKQGNGFSLPHFARAKSTFSKPNITQYNTLSFLSKTIFQQIESHTITRFHKHKPVQPLELGITKAKLMSKKQNKYLQKRRRHRENFNQREFEIRVYDVKRNQCQNSNRAKISKHKKTELNGWQQQVFDQQNFPQS